MQDAKIPEIGDKAALSKRHAKYVSLHNANFDSGSPKTLEQLRLDLIDWENGQNADRRKTRQVDFNDPGFAAMHLRKYENEFRDLVEQARQSLQAAYEGRSRRPGDEEEEESGKEDSPLDGQASSSRPNGMSGLAGQGSPITVIDLVMSSDSPNGSPIKPSPHSRSRDRPLTKEGSVIVIDDDEDLPPPPHKVNKPNASGSRCNLESPIEAASITSDSLPSALPAPWDYFDRRRLPETPGRDVGLSTVIHSPSQAEHPDDQQANIADQLSLGTSPKPQVHHPDLNTPIHSTHLTTSPPPSGTGPDWPTHILTSTTASTSTPSQPSLIPLNTSPTTKTSQPRSAITSSTSMASERSSTSSKRRMSTSPDFKGKRLRMEGSQ